MSLQTKPDISKKRAVLKDNSWIRRNQEEDEPVDYDPNPGKAVLAQRRSGGNVDSKPQEADQTSENSGISVSSLGKRFGGSQELLNRSSSSSINTKSGSVSKPPVPVKSPALKSPSSSSFTARVFSGANATKPSSPVKRTFGENLPEVTAAQNTNGVSQSPAPSATSTDVKSPVIQPALKSPSRTESVSVSSLLSKSSTPSAQTVITTTKTSSTTLKDTPKPAEKPSVDLKLSDFSYSSSRSPSSPPAVTLNTHYSYQTNSAPLDDLADALLPNRSGSVQPVRSQTQVKTVYSEVPAPSPTLQTLDSSRTQVKTVYSEVPAPSPTLRSPPQDSSRTQVKTVYSEVSAPSPTLQTLDSSRTQVKSVYSEVPAPSPTLRSPPQDSSRVVSSRDVCTVCGKPIAGSERMILEDLKIISHASCFRCAVCRCDLGGLEAGKSLWVYRERVNCVNCYSTIRGQWYM